MHHNSYDAIVLGAGGVGSAAMFHLARRGLRVLGIDQFDPPHERGSTHGDTRVIRKAYFEHPDYVPMLDRAYLLWEELQQLVGARLYHEVGLLQAGRTDGAVIPGVLASAKQHRLEIETIAAADLPARFPGFQAGDDMMAVFERRAGYLLVERCVQAHLELATAQGARLMTNCEVRSWRAMGSGFAVETSQGAVHAGLLAVCAGPWANRMLAELQLPLQVLRKPLFWFGCEGSQYDVANGCPTWLFETQAGIYYGFPRIDSWGVKAAEHTGGQPVADPLTVERDVKCDEQRQMERFLTGHLPGVSHALARHQVCMYTMTPDHHFIIDRHPAHPGMAFVAGLSGHGFKFAGMLGEALADLLLDGRSRCPIEFLSAKRFISSPS